MILAIIILLIAVLALAVISMIWDMHNVKKMESGMRTMYKRIKALDKAQDYLTGMDMEDITYEAVDTRPKEEDDSTSTDPDDGEIQAARKRI